MVALIDVMIRTSVYYRNLEGETLRNPEAMAMMRTYLSSGRGPGRSEVAMEHDLYKKIECINGFSPLGDGR